ncbi:MAG: vWA domain-containing protein [Candidatus Thiodiazotropha sp.]
MSKIIRDKTPRRSITGLIDKKLADLKNKQELRSAGREGNKSADVVFILLDSSGSMSGDRKISSAKVGTIDYMQKAREKGYQVGLISFGSTAQLICKPGSENFHEAVAEITCSGSTNMAEAIRLAVSMLVTPKGRKVVFLVTDGQPDDAELALNEAEKGKKLGVSFMTLGTDDADLAFLSRIATDEKFSAAVETRKLATGISSAAKLLEHPRNR